MPPGLELVPAGCGEPTLLSSSQSPVVHQETAAVTADAEQAPPHEAVCGAAPPPCDHQSSRPFDGCQRQLEQALGRQDGQLAVRYGAALWPETER